MTIEFLAVDIDSNAVDGFWEEAETRKDQTPQERAGEIVDRFNATLRPGEKQRKIVGVRQIGDDAVFIDPKEHDWEKTNFFTIVKRKQIYDTYKCRNCKATGKRYGLSAEVILDYRSRKKVNCNG